MAFEAVAVVVLVAVAGGYWIHWKAPPVAAAVGLLAGVRQHSVAAVGLKVLVFG